MKTQPKRELRSKPLERVLDLNPDLAFDLGLNLFLFNSFFSIIVNVQQSCKYSTDVSLRPFALLPLMSVSHITRGRY